MRRSNDFLSSPAEKCTSEDQEGAWWNVTDKLTVVTVPKLPVQNGTKITFKCPRKYVNKGGREAICHNKTLDLTGEPPECIKTGRFLF